MAEKLIEVAGLRPVDQLPGGRFRLLRAVVLILVLAVVVVSTSLRTRSWWTASVAAPWLGDAVASILPALDLQSDHLLPGT